MAAARGAALNCACAPSESKLAPRSASRQRPAGMPGASTVAAPAARESTTTAASLPLAARKSATS